MWRNRRTTRRQTRAAGMAAGRKFTRTAAPLPKSKVAARRRKLKALFAALMVVAIVCVLGLVSWLSFLNVFTATQISVHGTQDISKRAIVLSILRNTEKPLLGLFSRQNMLVYPSAELERIVAFEFPKIESITIVSKPIQRVVTVTIEEREAYAQWCDTQASRACYLLDRDGFIFEEVTAPSTTSLLFFGGVRESRTNFLRARVAPEKFAEVTTFISELERLGLTVRSFGFLHDEARLQVEPGWELKIALDDDLGIIAFNLAAVLDTYRLRDLLDSLLYIDMRFGERVYHKLRSADAHNTDDAEIADNEG